LLPADCQSQGAWLARALLCLFNVFIGKFSEGRWTAASPAMAYQGIWALLGFLSGTCVTDAFDHNKVLDIINEPAAEPGLYTFNSYVQDFYT